MKLNSVSKSGRKMVSLLEYSYIMSARTRQIIHGTTRVTESQIEKVPHQIKLKRRERESERDSEKRNTHHTIVQRKKKGKSKRSYHCVL